jgi:hypothetical protein
MSVAQEAEAWTETEHGLLVPLGRFAQQVGVVEAFDDVDYGMKTVDHSPADKVVELLAHLCSGGMHVNGLTKNAHPLVKDQAAARAWGQVEFASASGVSGLLHSVNIETVEAVKGNIGRVMEPRLHRLLQKMSPSFVVVDLDLTGLVVSDQAKDYEDASYGFMGGIGRIGRGYQLARAQLWTPDDTYALGGFLHPGATISQHCLVRLVGLVEAKVGRPRRRVECVQGRLEQTRQQLALLDRQLVGLGNGPQWQTRRERLTLRQQAKTRELAELEARVAQMLTDNESNPHPVRLILRMDGGFGVSEGLAWLWEQGYSFVAKAHNQRLAERLCQEAGLRWEKVTHNAFVAESTATVFGDCPYSLRLFVCRQWMQSDRPDHWSALAASPDLDPDAWDVRRVGTFYNGRQMIEAAIKESKGVLSAGRLPTGNRAGIVLYEEMVMLAQNLIRWLRSQVLTNTPLRNKGIKELVQVGANARAQVLRGQGALTIIYPANGPWPGVTLTVGQHYGFQLAFPFLDDRSLMRVA